MCGRNQAREKYFYVSESLRGEGHKEQIVLRSTEPLFHPLRKYCSPTTPRVPKPKPSREQRSLFKDQGTSDTGTTVSVNLGPRQSRTWFGYRRGVDRDGEERGRPMSRFEDVPEGRYGTLSLGVPSTCDPDSFDVGRFNKTLGGHVEWGPLTTPSGSTLRTGSRIYLLRYSGQGR